MLDLSKNAGELLKMRESWLKNDILFLIITFFSSKTDKYVIFSHFLSYYDRFRDKRVKLNHLWKSCVYLIISI